MNNVNLIPCGTIVITKIAKIEGIVTSVSVEGKNNDTFMYRVGYFCNQEYKAIWVNEFEINVKEDNSKPMGFSNNKQLT